MPHLFLARSRERNDFHRPPIHGHEASSQPPLRERGMGRTQEAGGDDHREGVGARSDAINIRVRASEGNQALERGGHWRPRREIETKKEEENEMAERPKQESNRLSPSRFENSSLHFIHVSSAKRFCVNLPEISSAATRTCRVTGGNSGSRIIRSQDSSHPDYTAS